MNAKFFASAAAAGIAALFACAPASADTAAGMKALRDGKFDVAIKEFKASAAKDDTEAMYMVGRMLWEGKQTNGKRSPLEATFWWEKAAYLDHVGAQLALGEAYRGGQGVKLDPGQGYVWDKKAADQGSAAGMRAIGEYYLIGKPVEKDPKEAAKWFRRGAMGGNIPAYMSLAKLLIEGEGVEKDLAAAYVLVTAAAKPVDGQPADRNAAADARNLRKELTDADAARAAKMTPADVLEGLKALDPDFVFPAAKK